MGFGQIVILFHGVAYMGHAISVYRESCGFIYNAKLGLKIHPLNLSADLYGFEV
jgi:hypothetical protein